MTQQYWNRESVSVVAGNHDLGEREALKAGIGSNRCVVGVRWASLIVGDRVVRAAVRNPKTSQDRVVIPAGRLGHHDSGER